MAKQKLLIIYTVNCSQHCAKEIALTLGCDFVGNESCFDNQDIINRLLSFCIHPNIGSVLVVGHGCEFIQADKIADFAIKNGRRAAVIYSQKLGTSKCIEEGIRLGRQLIQDKSDINFDMPIIGLKHHNLLAEARHLVTDLTAMGCAVITNKEYFACAGTANLNIADDRILRIAEAPTRPGLWQVDISQHKDKYKGYENASMLSDFIEFTSCGACLNILLTGKHIFADTPIAPLIVSESTNKALSAVKQIIEGQIDMPKTSAFSENILYRNYSE